MLHISAQRKSLCLLLVLLVYIVPGSALQYPSGVTIEHTQFRSVRIVVNPEVMVDTVTEGAGQFVKVTSSEAYQRYNRQGTTWQLCLDIPVKVSGANTLALTRSGSVPQVVNLAPLPPETFADENNAGLKPIVGQSVVRYAGISAGVHIAIATVVLAEWSIATNYTTIHRRAIYEFEVAPTTVAQSSPVQMGKSADLVQGIDALSPVARVTVESEGIFRLTAQQLQNAGLPVDADAARTIKVLGWGGRELSEQVEPPLNNEPTEQEIIVNTNADGSIRDVIFYGGGLTGWVWGNGKPEHYIHHYALQASYLITTAGGAGRRGSTRPAATVQPAHQPLTVDGFVFNEEELVSPYASGSGRKWFGRTVENGGAYVLTMPLPGLVRNGNVRYSMNVAHRGTLPGLFTMLESGSEFAQKSLLKVPQYMDMYSGRVAGSVPADKIAADNRSVVRFEYTCDDRIATGSLDWIEIVYPRGLIADNNTFTFFTDPGLQGCVEYSINGFDGSDVYAFDVTDPAQPVRVANVAPAGSIYSIREIADSGKVRRYFVSGKLLSATVSPLPALRLRSDVIAGKTGDYIIVTHPDLETSANAYAQYRAKSSGLKVSVVTTDAIMNEFGYGMQDPTAIRDYIGYAYRNAPVRPRYILFWGDGHFDYKNISTLSNNYVIPFESLDPDDSSWGLFTHTTEDFFVRVDGNDLLPDLAIGRLPIVSNTVGEQMLTKVRNYETESSADDWRTRIIMIADDGSTSNGESDRDMHLRQSESLASNTIPNDITASKVYLVEFATDNIARGKRKPGATAEMLNAINTGGALFVNWIGHGNPRVWSHEFVFERETTPVKMLNSNKYFFTTAATCDFARFDMADVQSGAEELVLLPESGSIGVFSAARVVFSDRNAALNEAFYRALFTRDENSLLPAVGDALRTVKQTFNGDNDEKFFLLGDPALRLLIPDHRVVFDSINGAVVSDTQTVQLQALSTVTISGYVQKPVQTISDTSFNGVATVSLFDGKRNITMTDDDVYKTVNKFSLPGALLARGSFRVVNGRFSATFIVPKDIAFSPNQARVHGYAYSDDRRTGRGVATNVVVDGVSDEQHDDDDGPDIAIFIDSRLFVEGQVVRANPILIVDLNDASGINAAGVGVGHDIEASFDNGSLIQVLTDNFTTSLDNPRAGTTSRQIFGLGPGYHTVEVRAWDVLNNVQTAQTSFRILESDGEINASWLMNYPNPFSGSTTIRYHHNAPRPFMATVSIYDVQGRKIIGRTMTERDMQTAEFSWDGRDSDGLPVNSGVYICTVEIRLDSGETGIVTGKLSLIR